MTLPQDCLAYDIEPVNVIQWLRCQWRGPPGLKMPLGPFHYHHWRLKVAPRSEHRQARSKSLESRVTDLAHRPALVLCLKWVTVTPSQSIVTIPRGFPGASDGNEFAFSTRDPGLIPGLERPHEKGIATHSSILAWRIPWTVEPGRLRVHGVAKSWTQLSD